MPRVIWYNFNNLKNVKNTQLESATLLKHQSSMDVGRF